MRLQHRLDGANRRVEPVGELAIGRLQPAGARGFAVERGGELAAVATERLQLLRQRVFVETL